MKDSNKPTLCEETVRFVTPFRASRSELLMAFGAIGHVGSLSRGRFRRLGNRRSR